MYDANGPRPIRGQLVGPGVQHRFDGPFSLCTVHRIRTATDRARGPARRSGQPLGRTDRTEVRSTMTRTDQDSWDLASSVGATATMVAAARAVASNGDQPDHQRPVRGAPGAGGRPRLLHPPGRRRAAAPEGARRRRTRPAAGDRFDRGAHPLLRRFLPQRRPRRCPPVGDSGRRPRRARLPAVLAARQRGLRSRSAQGHRVQDHHDGRPGRRPRRRPAHGQHRSAGRLAGRVAPQRIRRDASPPRGAPKAC